MDAAAGRGTVKYTGDGAAGVEGLQLRPPAGGPMSRRVPKAEHRAGGIAGGCAHPAEHHGGRRTGGQEPPGAASAKRPIHPQTWGEGNHPGGTGLRGLNQRVLRALSTPAALGGRRRWDQGGFTLLQQGETAPGVSWRHEKCLAQMGMETPNELPPPSTGLVWGRADLGACQESGHKTSHRLYG